jgi:AsmA protein
MNKPVKYGLLGLGGLLLLVVVGVAVFAMTFDPNRYKGQVERMVKEKTGRTLQLKGDIQLAFWPSLGAQVAGVSFSEKNSPDTFLSLDSAHASVKLMPLLSGQAIVDGIRVSGLKANVVKEKDGTFNFSDLLKAQGEAGKEPPAKPSPEQTEGGQAVAFDIASIHIDRSAVSYLDRASGQQLELADFRLETGRIAERASGNLELGAAVKGKNPELDLKVSASGGYRVDLPDNSYAVSKLDATLAGTASGQKIDARIASPELVVAKDQAKGELTAVVKSDDLQANLKLAGLEGSAKALVISQLSGDVAMKNMKASLNGSARADLEKETADADLTAKLDESNIKAKVGLAKFSPPAYRFDLAIDQLNVDKYFPPEQPATQPAAAPVKPEAAQKTEKTESPIDFSALKGLDAEGQLQVGSFQARGLKLANLKAKVRAAGGRLDVSPHSADLYQGSLTGALGVQAQGNRVTLKETLTNVSVGPLLREFAQKDILEGRGNVALDVTAAGASVEQMKKSLAGSAKLALRDGAIKGINLAERVRQAKAMFSGDSAARGETAVDKTQKTDFSELTASFSIKGGVAHNEDLDIKSPLFRIGGAGDVDIGNSRLDYTTKAAVVATTKGQGGEDLEKLRGLTVPVRLHGPFDDLKYDVDYRGAAQGALKSRAGEKLKERVEERKDKLEERLGDRLKGLLKR